MTSDDALLKLAERARAVSLGSLDGIHDLVADAYFICGKWMGTPVICDRERLAACLRKAIAEREGSGE